MAKHLVTRSWPITQGLPLALHKLTEGTVSTDFLVAYTPFFFFFFLDPKYWGRRSGAQGTNRGLTSSKKGAARVTLSLRDFRKNAELSMCGLTTEWILESAQSLACALTITWILEERSMPWSGELLILRSERELRRSEGSGKLIDDPLWWGEQYWLDQQGEGPITELWGAEKLGRSEGSGMLIGDPLVEGSSASSTDGELWRAENSFLRMRGTQLPMRSSRAENSLLRLRGNSDARKGAACS